MTNRPFDKPIYVTSPLLPDLNKFHDRLHEIWDAKWLTNYGREHRKLEQQLLDYLKVPHISLFNNGTSALLAGLRALNLSGEVITTPFTFAATPHAITLNQLQPVFCDIDPITMNIDPLKIEEKITSKTSAILAVHVFGTPCDVYKIQEIANKYKLKVMYDAAHAFGCEVDGTSIGNFGDLTMFSFHATKLFHTTEGGALTFKDEALGVQLSLLRNFGIVDEETVQLVGFNGKLNELQALMGQLVLELVQNEQHRRSEIFDLYSSHLGNIDGITLLPQFSNIKSSFQYYVIKIDGKVCRRNRDEVYEELKKFNVFTRKYFHPLCSNFDCYNEIESSNPSNLPMANQVAKEVLSLPFYGGLANEDVERICELLKSLI